MYESYFLTSLLITLCIEEFSALLFLTIVYRKTPANRKIATITLTVAVANLLTLPYVWFVFPVFIKDHLIYVLASETTVVIVEALLYYAYLHRRIPVVLATAIIANGASFLFGELLKFYGLGAS